MHEQVEGGFGAWYRRHRWWADPLGMAIFAVVMAAFGFRGIWGPFSLLQEPLSPWWALVLALPACAIALFKRRMPVTVLVLVSLLFVADLLTVGGLGTLVVLLDVLWTAAFLADSRGRRMLLVLLGAATVVLFLCAWLLTDVSFPVAFLIGVQFGAIFGTDYWWAVAVSQAHELAELHRQRAEHAAAVAERDRVEAVQRERETMARELHDVVAGHVMAMAIRAEAALSTPPDPPRDREALQAVRDAGLDAHAALRSMISVLRRGEGSPASSPRWGDLEGIVQEAERAGLTVRLVADHVGDVGSALEQAVIRIVREALNNCIRHASGAEVDVIIRRSGPEVRVEVRSRGGSPSGASTSADGGWGLQMLRERVAALGGAFIAGPVAGGWSVEGRIPTEAAA
ncbi:MULTISPECIES: sensor histidine kinase [unclassified Microbacterium]|uniref:sensor histidine kinase n=1 Tax=unclassified Microbacterium TaxID=2609290 RepID=UPI000DE1ED57|nr:MULTISPECIES: histidine kinase [unclassified Microbacterium]NYF29880.1 signal transduction histidine kinase [Microbacterium sp. JAI119]RBO73651.1 sensor histidine kinase [Microbacterium sp. H6]